MKTWIVDAHQGSPEWHAHRAKSFNASDLACAMGIDPNGRKRSDLVRQYATGIEQEFSDYVQEKIIAPGHEIEAAARAIIEARIGESLYPVVLAGELNGMILSASMDGLTADDDKSFECKRKNNGLLESVLACIIPEGYKPQMEQGLMLSGAEVCIFTVSDGTEEGTISCEYRSDPELRAKIEPTWRQFAEDVAAYQHVDHAPAPVAAAIEALPALIVQVEGHVISSNLDAFKARAMEFIGTIKTDLKTDQDFADADKISKFLKDGEDRLTLVKSQTLAQTASIDELFKAIDYISQEMRTRRIALEKLVESRKSAIKSEIVQAGQQALKEHVTKLNARIGDAWMPVIEPGFQAAIKGLRSLDSLRNAVDTALARAKIEANEIADRIEANHKALAYDGEAGSHIHLFPDFAQVCTKEQGDFINLLNARVKADLDRKEAERERIRKEEAEHLQREYERQLSQADSLEQRELAKEQAAQNAPQASVATGTEGAVSDATSAHPVSTATMKLGELNTRLAPISITADGLDKLGIKPVGQDKRAVLYRESDLPIICDAMIHHLQGVAMLKAA